MNNDHLTAPGSFSEGQNEDTKKKPHRATLTSKLSYRDAILSGLIKTQESKVYKAIEQYQYCTSRSLSYVLNIERTNITRSLKDLEDGGLIEVAYIAPCKFTGRKVQYYTVKKEGGCDEISTQ